jgi:predicted Zn finger-like uncharacterized protein
MSMITGCPACGTMFRVVPDQLKISDGWVRCGHCAEVFDASAQLREEPAASRFAEAEPAPPESIPPTSIAPEPDQAEPVDVAPLLVRAESGPAPVERRRAEPPTSPLPLAAPPSDPEDFADAQFDNDPLTDGEAKALMRVADDSRFAPSGYGAGPETAPPSRSFASSRMELEDADPGDMSFVRQARRSAFWSRPGMRVLLAFAGLGLAALLFAQYAVHERDRLAATDPSWRPWLRALCAPLDCTIGPPKRIEAILIDNSGFTRLRPDAYRLSFSLRNQSTQPVAIPALQLTLTDTSDQPVLQRVFTPRELGAASDTIAPSSDFAASLALAVDGGAASRVAGYRLLAFYP